jgi:hypothetical protein
VGRRFEPVWAHYRTFPIHARALVVGGLDAYNLRMLITANQVQSFKQDGILIIKNFYSKDEIDGVRKGIYSVIGQTMKKYGLLDQRQMFTGAEFDSKFNEIIIQDRTFGSLVYDQVKNIPEFLHLMSDPRHSNVFTQLREDSIPMVAGGGYGIRIDNPNEDKYRAYWHQEYPAQLRSLNGIVFWSPLVEMSAEIGPVQFLPQSQKEGPLPVFQDFGSEEQKRSGAYALRLSEESLLLEKYKLVAPILEVGDVVCVDFLTVHASGYNRSNRSRWSMQYRYFDMAHESGRKFGWQGSYAEGVNFSSIHPELLMQGEI